MRLSVAFLLTLLLAAGCGGEIASAPGADDGAGDGTGTGTDTGTDTGGPTDPPPPQPPQQDPTCDEVTPITIEPAEPPDMLLVVDKSGSMGDPLDNGQEKWPVMRSALTNVVDDFEDGINFGLMLYPRGDECAPGNVSVGTGAGNAGSIASVLRVTGPEGGTPTDTSMQGALDYYRGQPANPGGRFVLLATDGQPNCVNRDTPNEPAIDEAVASIAALTAEGISTYVLGFGDGVADDTLQRMATAGGTGAFFAANSPAELAAALEAIADELALPPCTLTLSEEPPDEQELAVYFDDVAVPRSPGRQDGWEYDAATNAITLYGTACEALQSGAVDEVRVDYGCGGGPIIE